MKTPLSSEASAALAKLVQRWPRLKNDVDRGNAVTAVHRMGVSTRDLGKALHCSASRIRLLIQAAKAPVADQLLAIQGKISARELAWRSMEAKKQAKAKELEAQNQRRMKEAKKDAKLIGEWLESEGRDTSRGEAIINEARRILDGHKRRGTLPKCAPPPAGTPVATIIERMRPPKSVNEDTGFVSWYADWLARWAFYAFSDEIVRDQALNSALDAEIRGDR